MTKTRTSESIALILSGAFFWFWMSFASRSVYNETGSIRGHNFNLTAYLVGAAATFLLYLLLSLLLGLASRLYSIFWVQLALSLFYTVIALGAVYCLYRIYRYETVIYPGDVVSSYLWQMVPPKPYFLMILLLTVLTWASITDATDRRRRMVMVGLFALINAILLYAPNFMADPGGGTQHIDAYTTSIVNLLHHTPYSPTNVSIYGHYALFYLPLVRLFGSSYTAIALAIAAFAFIAYGAVFLTAELLIDRDWLLFTALLAITGTTTILNRRGQYYQINPHRILCPALVLLFVAFIHVKHQHQREMLRWGLEILLGTFTLLWNLETGLFSVIILSAVHVYDQLEMDHLFSLQMLLTILKCIVYLILTALLAFGIVGIYNLAAGGSFGTVKDYIYPLLSDSYQVSSLQLPLPGEYAAYLPETIVFVLTASVLLIRRVVRDEPGTPYDTVLFAVSLSGCASILYFLNRTAFGNMSMQHVQFALLMALLALHAAKLRLPELVGIYFDAEKTYAFLSSAVCYLVLCYLAVQSILTFPAALSNRATTTWNMATYQAIADDITATVPSSTLAYGIGMPQLYQELGLDTRCHTTDTLDLNIDETAMAYRNELIQNEDAVLTTEVLDPETWDIQKEWTMPTGYIIRYAVRSKSETK